MIGCLPITPTNAKCGAKTSPAEEASVGAVVAPLLSFFLAASAIHPLDERRERVGRRGLDGVVGLASSERRSFELLLL